MAAETIPFKASSHLRSITYDRETGEMVAVFDNGSYSYAGVPADVAAGFTDAESAGKYLRSAIIGTYQAKKL